MKVVIGADHRGFERKGELKALLRRGRHRIRDAGTRTAKKCDYPLIAERVARDVAEGKSERGILLCMSGVGMCIAANKIRGVRAALCHNVRTAELSRRHNNANVLVLSSGDLEDPLAEIVREWLRAPFDGGRHARRVRQIEQMERKYFK